jgi:hypothetical protein
MSDVIGQDEEKSEPEKTAAAPEDKKVVPEEPKLKSTKYKAWIPRMKFDPVAKSFMLRPKLTRLNKEREMESQRQGENFEEGQNNGLDGVKAQFAPQKANPLELSQETPQGPAPPDAEPGPSKIQDKRMDHFEADSIRPLSDSKENSDDDHHSLTAAELAGLDRETEEMLRGDSLDEEHRKQEARKAEQGTPEQQIQRMDDEKAQELRDKAAAEPNFRRKLEVLLWDPYQIGGYRHLSVILAFLSSIYIIGIGVTMAITPNVRTLVYTSIPLVPEASVKAVGGIMQVWNDWQTYGKGGDWRKFRTVVMSHAKRWDLEAATEQARDMASRERTRNKVEQKEKLYAQEKEAHRKRAFRNARR